MSVISRRKGAIPGMEQQEQDLVVIMDDDGNELTMEVVDYFFYEGQEYAVLVEAEEEESEHDCSQCECGCEHGDDDEAQQEAYIMRVVPVGDDQEEFIPVEEDMLEKLIEFVQNDLYDDIDEDFDEEEESEEE